ncbi:aldose epimerase family protein [Daejeonella oryzae]|uniref:aldose epimerase family protein n=1 Tax=Daejeonella oryzae TaxID=1122943 RepID=UPI0004275DE2|nr:aldose epimerase family protein [Daejeonella oryzae]
MKAERSLTNINHKIKEIYSFILENDHGMQVVLSNYGGLIQKISVPDSSGIPTDVVLGFDDLKSYLSEEYLKSYPYFGVIIGRYANRILNSAFRLGDKNVKVSKNDGENQLHGGLEGFDKKVWDVFELGTEPNPHLVLSYLSKDGEEGFPGNLEVKISFTLTNDQELIVEISAITDQSTAVNMTHHGYFNLNGDARSIEDHIIKIPAKHILAQDENYVPNGKLIPVLHTAHDFTSEKAVNQDWNPEEGYDQAFVLDKKEGVMSLSASAYSKKTGIKMEVFSNQPVVQFYTSKHLNVENGKKGQSYKPFSGFCFETQVHPNAINIPSFPNTILNPGEVYDNTTTFKFSKA